MIFYQVVRIYRQHRRVLAEGDSRARADTAFSKALKTVHSGDIIFTADGAQQRAFHGGYNRTRW